MTPDEIPSRAELLIENDRLKVQVAELEAKLADAIVENSRFRDND